MPVSVTPTLSSVSGYLVDIRDQVSNLLRFMIMNPGGTSDLWEDNLISFRYISSSEESDRSSLCDTLKTTMSNILKRKFTDYTFEVDFYSENYSAEDDGRYTVVFHITITNIDAPVIVSGTINVDPKTNSIELKYDKSVDNITIN